MHLIVFLVVIFAIIVNIIKCLPLLSNNLSLHNFCLTCFYNGDVVWLWW